MRLCRVPAALLLLVALAALVQASDISDSEAGILGEDDGLAVPDVQPTQFDAVTDPEVRVAREEAERFSDDGAAENGVEDEEAGTDRLPLPVPARDLDRSDSSMTDGGRKPLDAEMDDAFREVHEAIAAAQVPESERSAELVEIEGKIGEAEGLIDKVSGTVQARLEEANRKASGVLAGDAAASRAAMEAGLSEIKAKIDAIVDDYPASAEEVVCAECAQPECKRALYKSAAQVVGAQFEAGSANYDQMMKQAQNGFYSSENALRPEFHAINDHDNEAPLEDSEEVQALMREHGNFDAPAPFPSKISSSALVQRCGQEPAAGAGPDDADARFARDLYEACKKMFEAYKAHSEMKQEQYDRARAPLVEARRRYVAMMRELADLNRRMAAIPDSSLTVDEARGATDDIVRGVAMDAADTFAGHAKTARMMTDLRGNVQTEASGVRSFFSAWVPGVDAHGTVNCQEMCNPSSACVELIQKHLKNQLGSILADWAVPVAEAGPETQALPGSSDVMADEDGAEPVGTDSGLVDSEVDMFERAPRGALNARFRRAQ